MQTALPSPHYGRIDECPEPLASVLLFQANLLTLCLDDRSPAQVILCTCAVNPQLELLAWELYF